MSEFVVDACVVAKWLLPEVDDAKAMRILKQAISTGERLIVVDIALAEVVNAIWKRQRRGLTSLEEARTFLESIEAFPLQIESSKPLLKSAFEIATKYDRSAYDALFVALSQKLGIPGVTSDEPLFNAVRSDFPQIQLLRLM